MKQKVIELIEKHRIIAILRGIHKEDLLPLSEALYQGGIRLLEVTYSNHSLQSDEDTADLIKLLSENMKNKLEIGAGTVLTEKQVRFTHDAGGSFIISPNTDGTVIKETLRLGMVSIPGALTPTEVVAAHNYGADLVKLFPVTSLGTEYIKAIRSPLANIKLLAVGGVDLNNINEYLRAGACGVGIGACIADKGMIRQKNWEGIAKLARAFTERVENE